MTIATATATERLAAYRTHHRIEVDDSDDPYIDRCDTDGLRVYQVRRLWRHDRDDVRALELAAAREAVYAGTATFDEPERVARVITEASAPLRRFERQVVVESGPGWIATADVEDDPPDHDHFDIWDSTDSCPRCAWDQLRAEG